MHDGMACMGLHAANQLQDGRCGASSKHTPWAPRLRLKRSHLGRMSATLSRPMYTAFSMWPHSNDLRCAALRYAHMQPGHLDSMCPKHHLPRTTIPYLPNSLPSCRVPFLCLYINFPPAAPTSPSHRSTALLAARFPAGESLLLLLLRQCCCCL